MPTQHLHAPTFGHANPITMYLPKLEIGSAVKKFKSGGGGGADGLRPEHLKYGGHSMFLWLQRVTNINNMEDNPASKEKVMTH